MSEELEAVKAERDALAAELEKWIREATKQQAAADKASESLLNLHEWGYHCKEEFDALAAELARVKAESLRVVKDGVAGPFDDMDARFIEYNNHIYQWNEVLDHDKSAIPIYGGRPVGIRLNNRDVPVQPVRLEHWENCDETD